MSKRITVYHTTYGCDTGCCGHTIEMEDGQKHFDFAHPFLATWGKTDHSADFREFAEDTIRQYFGEEHVQDLDWENCNVQDY